MTLTYASMADLDSRYPAELTLLAADETTGLRDDQRIGHALDDASIEIRAILTARYSASDLARLDADALAVLRVYAMDIALYRIAITFSRSSEAIRERYEQSIKRLEAIATGKGALSLTTPSTGAASDLDGIAQNEVILNAPDRVFTRQRLGRI